LPAIYERLSTGGGEFLAELRPAYPMFVRFGGIDYDDDADAIAKLDDFVRRAQRILAAYGGNVLNMTLGDKGAYLASVVGAPQAHEDDAARAASAALELRELESATAVTDIQIGITYGRLRSGTYGHRRRQAFTCLGNAVNLSARLMGKAPPRQIYVAEPVRHAAGDTFDWEQLPPLTVKGRAEPVSVFALAGSKRRASRRQASFDLPMVGRQAELDTLAAKLDEALAGRGQIVGISAEAGMGKSRLVAEFARTVEPSGITIAVGECQSFRQEHELSGLERDLVGPVSPRQPGCGGRAGAIAGGGAGGDRPSTGAAGAAALAYSSASQFPTTTLPLRSTRSCARPRSRDSSSIASGRWRARRRSCWCSRIAIGSIRCRANSSRFWVAGWQVSVFCSCSRTVRTRMSAAVWASRTCRISKRLG
jgi:class 3 adenylate cyclase